MSGSNFNNTDNPAVDSDSTQSLDNKTINGVDLKTDQGSSVWLDGEGNYTSPAGAGDVVGPASAVDGNLTAFDGTSGTLIKDSGVAFSDLMDGAVYDPTSVEGDAFLLSNMNGDTDDVAEGSNLYYTEARVDANASVVANTAKVSNVTTNLSIGTTTATTVNINSSDGTNATLPAAIATTAAGLLTGADKAKIDGIEAGAEVNDDIFQNIYDRDTPSILVDNSIGPIELDNTGKTVAPLRIKPNATAPTTGLTGGEVTAGADGQLYSYDSTRSKFLGLSPYALQFGKNNGSGNEYVRFGGDARDGNAGVQLIKDATIVGLTIMGSNSVAAGFEIEIDGTDTGTTYTTSAGVYVSSTLNIDVNLGERINLFSNAVWPELEDVYTVIWLKDRL